AWYPPLWLRGLGSPFRYRDSGRLARHLRFVERSCRKLARESFHGMVVYQAKMERKQGFLFRCVDIVMELFAMAASVCHARRLRDDDHAEAGGAAALADLFCRQSRRRVRRLFRDLWSNEDARKNDLAASLMRGEHVWLEEGRLDLGFGPDAFKTRSITRAVAPEPERKRATPSKRSPSPGASISLALPGVGQLPQLDVAGSTPGQQRTRLSPASVPRVSGTSRRILLPERDIEHPSRAS